MRTPLLLVPLGAIALVVSSATVAAGPSRIAFVSLRDPPHKNSELYVMNADGSDQHRVRTSPGLVEGSSSWSPDGLRIVFEISEPGFISRRLGVLGRLGGVKVITDASTDSAEPEWSPDGKRIAFAQARPRGGYRIMTIAPNGSGPAAVTRGRFDREPTWSPDGKRIAYTHDGELWVVNADGTGAMRLSKGFFNDPVWSPDGARIAFVRASPTGAGELYTIAATGGRARRLTTTPQSEVHPTWSPDGSEIAYQLRAYAGDIYVMKADGTNVRRLTTDQGSQFPSWTR